MVLNQALEMNVGTKGCTNLLIFSSTSLELLDFACKTCFGCIDILNSTMLGIGF